MKRLPIAIAALSTLVAGAAHADSGFATKHDIILSADRLFPLFSYTKITASADVAGGTNKDSTSGASLVLLYGAEPATASFNTVPRAAFDFAVIDHLTVGGTVVLAFGLSATNTQESDTGGAKRTTEVDAPKSTIIGIAPRVGYAISLGDLLDFWPRLGFSYMSISTKQTTQNGNNTVTTKDTDGVFSINVEPMFTLTPVRHVFFQFGPVLDISLTGTRKTETGNQSIENDLSVFHFGVETGLGVNF